MKNVPWKKITIGAVAALILSTVSDIATGQIFRTLSIDATRDFEIEHEDSTVSRIGPNGNESFKIASDLMVANNDIHTDIHEMKFTQAGLTGDTLTILIFEAHPSLRHEYWIKIVKDKYMIDYRSLLAGEVKRKIKPEGFGLILNTSDIGPGKELRGYTEYRGNCVKGCSRDKVVIIRGNFKVRIE